MTDMSIQDRFDDIVRRAGLSEDIVRRVLKASRESLAVSLKKGQRATLPGICTMVPEVRSRVNIGAESVTNYIKIKANPSSAMESELSKLGKFNSSDEEAFEAEREKQALSRLRFKDPTKKSFGDNVEVRTNQISALL